MNKKIIYSFMIFITPKGIIKKQKQNKPSQLSIKNLV